MLQSWNGSHNFQLCRRAAMPGLCYSKYSHHEYFTEFKIKSMARTGNWNGNLNYWTGGTQSCKGMWGWCAGNKFKSFTANLTWLPEHFKNENCLHLKIFRNGSSILNDRACKDKYIYACQVETPRF
jgi:hypothetical protein